MHAIIPFADQTTTQAKGMLGLEQNRTLLADELGRRRDMHGLQIRGSPDELAGMAAGLLEQDRQRAAQPSTVEVALLAVQQILQDGEALFLHGLGDLVLCKRRRRAGTRAVLERKRLSEADVADQRERGLESRR